MMNALTSIHVKPTGTMGKNKTASYFHRSHTCNVVILHANIKNDFHVLGRPAKLRNIIKMNKNIKLTLIYQNT